MASTIGVVAVNTPKLTVAPSPGAATALAVAYQVTSAGSGLVVPRYVNRTVRSQRPRSFRTKRPGAP